MVPIFTSKTTSSYEYFPATDRLSHYQITIPHSTVQLTQTPLSTQLDPDHAPSPRLTAVWPPIAVPYWSQSLNRVDAPLKTPPSAPATSEKRASAPVISSQLHCKNATKKLIIIIRVKKMFFTSKKMFALARQQYSCRAPDAVRNIPPRLQ